jgi:AcrR family transcriptional regulator
MLDHMSRTANDERPVELLDAIVDYLTMHGVADLSLRPLAKGIGSSPRVLLYYFGSKDDLVIAALAHLRQRERRTWDPLPFETFADLGAIWRDMRAPAAEPWFRLFFETYGLALRDPRRFQDFLHSAVEDWLGYLTGVLRARGYTRAGARAVATVVLAGFRGFMLDYCASADRARLDRAVRLWLRALDSLPPC